MEECEVNPRGYRFLNELRRDLHRCLFGSSWGAACARGKCGLNVLTWLSRRAASGSGGRVIQVLECEVPIELWKWELSREMGIAPRWFVTFAALFGAFGVCIHHSFNQKMCVVPLVTFCDRERLYSTCLWLRMWGRVCVCDSMSHPSPSPGTELN